MEDNWNVISVIHVQNTGIRQHCNLCSLMKKLLSEIHLSSPGRQACDLILLHWKINLKAFLSQNIFCRDLNVSSFKGYSASSQSGHTNC